MEALQMLKFYLKKERLNFTAAWMMAEEQMIDNVPDRDFLVDLLDGSVQECLDRITRSVNEGDEI
jgi:hypothetical protein